MVYVTEPYWHPPCLSLSGSFKREDWGENLEAVVYMEQSVHDVFLVNEIYVCWGQALGQITFKLCNAQPQFLWSGLRSTSMSCIAILPSDTLKHHLRCSSGHSFLFLPHLWCTYVNCYLLEMLPSFSTIYIYIYTIFLLISLSHPLIQLVPYTLVIKLPHFDFVI